MESFAATAFYIGAAGLVFGSIRVVRASIEFQRRDRAGQIALAAGAILLCVAIAMFLHSPRGVLPF
jgi:uncharacterized membrane protein HdeD (DUF308 family)